MENKHVNKGNVSYSKQSFCICSFFFTFKGISLQQVTLALGLACGGPAFSLCFNDRPRHTQYYVTTVSVALLQYEQ